MASVEKAEKFFLKSKTIIGVIVSVLPALLPAVGVTFSAEDGAFVSANIDAIIQGAGALLAMYGRFVAKGAVTAT